MAVPSAAHTMNLTDENRAYHRGDTGNGYGSGC